MQLNHTLLIKYYVLGYSEVTVLLKYEVKLIVYISVCTNNFL